MNSILIRRLLFVKFLGLLFLLQLNAYSYVQAQQQFFYISKFVDGDTFWISKPDGSQEKIRLIGIDTPESRNSGKKKATEFGKEAAAYVKQLLTDKKIRLEYDVGKYDRFNRTLAYVYLEDGTFLNAHLVQQGYAKVMTVPPNVKHANLFLKLEREARSKRRGLWK
jgi:micrococcal nuclease